MGHLVPGWFPVPQNPINPIAGEWPSKYRPTIGEILPMRFKVPSNPVLDYIRAGAAKEREADLKAADQLMGLGSCCAGCAQEGETVISTTSNGQMTALPADMVAGLNSDVEGLLSGIGGVGTLLVGLALGWMAFGKQ